MGLTSIPSDVRYNIDHDLDEGPRRGGNQNVIEIQSQAASYLWAKEARAPRGRSIEHKNYLDQEFTKSRTAQLQDLSEAHGDASLS